MATNAAIGAFAGALTQEHVKDLATAVKAKLTPLEWDNLCKNNQNAGTNNKKIWQLLQFTIAGNAITTEADAAAPGYLDYTP